MLNTIQRAVCISVQTKQKSLYDKICIWFNDFLIHKVTIDDSFLSLRIIELFIELKSYDVSLLLSTLDTILLNNRDDVSKMERAYKLKTQCLSKLKKKEEAKNNNLSLANYYVDFAEQTRQKDIQSAIRAETLFQKAITLYRNNGALQQAENTHKRLVEIQKEISKFGIPLSVERNIKNTIDTIKINMEGLTFEESIIRLTQMIAFDTQETIKNRVIKECKEFPLSHLLFGKSLVNSQGQTILSLPPLDIQDFEKDQKLLELHMHQNALHHQELIGEVLIKRTLYLIKDNFTIDNSMIEFLVKDNAIIPKGRERIFQSAIGMFLRGEFYEAMHILAPQVENLFRNLAREVGGLTVTLENDGSSMEKVLSSIFNLPELLDCYDNDILFTFKGLLNERAGANIRNKIAHGIIEESTCSSGACLYFGVAVIKLLTYTSTACYKILNNSEKLKHFKTSSKD